MKFENPRNLSKKLSSANHLCHTFHHILTTNYHPLKHTKPSENAPSTIAKNPLAVTQKFAHRRASMRIMFPSGSVTPRPFFTLVEAIRCL